MKNNKLGLKKFIPVGIGLLTFAAFVGSISGSLAWWAYSTRAAVTYQGTSVTTSEQLQIGVKLDKTKFTSEEIESLETNYGLTVDDEIDDEDYYYAFSEAGGGLSAEAVGKYLEFEGVYATNKLSPVTSRSYENGDDIVLYESLIFSHPVNTALAETVKYVRIPFVFRIVKFNAVSRYEKFAGGRDIYVSKAIAEASTTTPTATVQDAIRVHFNNGTAAEQFILNPGDRRTGTDSATIASMKTPVAGILDIGGTQGYYDADELGNEIIYGDYEVTGTPSTFVQSDEPEEKLVNINGISGLDDDYLSNLENRSTFLARHEQGNTCYSSYTGLTFKTQQYKTLALIKPDDTQAKLSGGTPVCTTAETGDCLAELELTIWLEGWDHNVVDKAAEEGHKFNLGLQFQIDIVS